MEIAKHTIQIHETVSLALEKLNKLGEHLTLFVINNNDKVLGTITDGDIRRGLLNHFTLEDPVSGFMHTTFHFLRNGESNQQKISEFKEKGIKIVPLLDIEDKIIQIINTDFHIGLLPICGVIMAGGEGVRLRPLTENTPKPLLHIGPKPIIEYGIEQLVKYGVHDITISVNYLADQIINHLKDGTSKDAKIRYIKEEKKLGTIGSVSLSDGFTENTVLVMNADLLTNINIEDFYNNFISSGATMSVACIPYKVNVPYAILDIDDKYIKSLKEKPTYTYYSNAGIYLIKREALSHIPHNESFNATDLIEHIINIDQKVSYFPILGYWLDIGNMNDFHKAQEDIKYIKI
jgi:dTDP-glucose pyrophosphorylase